jgi:hypothetical protein
MVNKADEPDNATVSLFAKYILYVSPGLTETDSVSALVEAPLTLVCRTTESLGIDDNDSAKTLATGDTTIVPEKTRKQITDRTTLPNTACLAFLSLRDMISLLKD